ncbi:MAG: hypothetical protein AB1489_31640 [Acidobacteriota bacterium]
MDKNFETQKEHVNWSTGSLILVVGVLIIAATIIVFSTAPFVSLLGPGTYALGGALHGLVAFVLLVVATVGLYLGWRLFTGRIKAFPDLQLVTVVMSVLSFITIVFGNWIYIAYRAKTPDSPRSYFIANMPEIHKIFFEFKEFGALFTLPLAVSAAFILWYYGKQILEKNWIRITVAIMMALYFFYFAIAFGLGAAVTKLKSI